MKLSFWISILILALPRLVLSTVDARGSVPHETQSRVVGIDPTFGNLYHETFEAMRHDRHTETIAKATAALAMKPDPKRGALLFACRGLAYSGLKNYARAVADFGEAIRLDPAVDTARANRGLILAYLGEDERAIADLTHAGRVGSLGLTLHATLGNAYLKTGRKNLARGEYVRVAQLPVQADAEYALRAYAEFAIGQYKAAASDWRAAGQRLSNDWGTLNEAAWFEATCPDAAVRDGQAAVRDASRACEGTHWKDGGFIDTLAAAYAETGDFAHAVQYGKRAVSLGGKHSGERREVEQHLRLFEKGKPVREGGKLL